MRKAAVYLRGEFAGELTEASRNEYIFRYDNDYFKDSDKPDISIVLNKSQQEYRSGYLFPFFFNMLSEGVNRELQSILLKIDEEDHFGLLAATAQVDSI
jgi:serine/threonine-protein kinase HipA